VLAAGRSSRFGSNKLLYDLSGDTLLARSIRACGSYPAVVVTNSEVAAVARGMGKPVIVNDEPERGMAYSLRLANAQIDAEHAIAVLPADLLYIAANHVAMIVEQVNRADVTFPARNDGTPGHPVVFSADARRYIATIPDGDSIRLLRDRIGLTRRIVPVEEPWPYHDVDSKLDLAH
jgi:molybdenum cofactor cytidylyltransferase